MPKSKTAQPAKVAAKPAPTAEVSGTVLKVAFPKLDDEGRKTLRRHLRQALRSQGVFKDAPGQFRFHKIGSRWVFPTAKDVAAARKVAAGISSLNG